MPAGPVPAAAPRGRQNTQPADLWQAWWRMFGVRAPLSGDVIQDLVGPSLLRDHAQLRFLNINAMRAGDPALEQRIITEVASYGRQLGPLVDAVGVLARQQERAVVPLIMDHPDLPLRGLPLAVARHGRGR